ncbi:MAG: hypothetical protein H0V53_08695 [Rubrobacter sp.]|nr:hypothetical protein [Rubrobacter sp.]
MDTKNTERQTLRPGEYEDEEPLEPGLGRWIRRNTWLLVRLFMVVVFTFGASTTAANFSYGLESRPVELTVEQINAGQLPEGLQLEDYVRITGTPDYSINPDTGQPSIGVSDRYSARYFYFGLQETGDNLLIQTAETPPDIADDGEQVYRGKLSNVATVIFHDTTSTGLEIANLPTEGATPIVETGDTPEYYRQIFPAYSAILGVWFLAIGWLVWKRNEPFAGV